MVVGCGVFVGVRMGVGCGRVRIVGWRFAYPTYVYNREGVCGIEGVMWRVARIFLR